jgi:hypothetical protein
MSKESLERQADRAERLADNTVDESLKKILLDAARDYREQAKRDEGNRITGAPAWLHSGLEHPGAAKGF